MHSEAHSLEQSPQGKRVFLELLDLMEDLGPGFSSRSPDKKRRETDRRRRRGWEICLHWVDRADMLKLLDLKWDMAKERV